MTLRVALDARALDIDYLRGQGIGRYTAALLEALGPVSRRRGGQLIIMRAAGSSASPFAQSGIGSGSIQLRLRRPPLTERLAVPCEQLLLPIDLRRAHAQVLHSGAIFRAVPAPGLPTVSGPQPQTARPLIAWESAGRICST